MATIVLTSFGKNVCDIDEVKQLAQDNELEIRIHKEGVVVFFDTDAQRTWFHNQLKEIA